MNQMEAISKKGTPKLNIIITPEGLERVTILGGVNLTLEAMDLYRTIAGDVMEIDKKIRKSAMGKNRLGKTKVEGESL